MTAPDRLLPCWETWRAVGSQFIHGCVLIPWRYLKDNNLKDYKPHKGTTVRYFHGMFQGPECLQLLFLYLLSPFTLFSHLSIAMKELLKVWALNWLWTLLPLILNSKPWLPDSVSSWCTMQLQREPHLCLPCAPSLTCTKVKKEVLQEGSVLFHIISLKDSYWAGMAKWAQLSLSGECVWLSVVGWHQTTCFIFSGSIPSTKHFPLSPLAKTDL